jgi:hypothetical protein
MGLRNYRSMVAKLPKWVRNIIQSDDVFLFNRTLLLVASYLFRLSKLYNDYFVVLERLICGEEVYIRNGAYYTDQAVKY